MNIYTHMQTAVDIVVQSPHPTNKIAATIAGEGWAFSCINHWPAIIEEKIGRDPDIGNSSGTTHAETACIFAANRAGHTTKDASLFITDPPCPNCMKNMAEAGITKLYIDHKGFDKDWSKRRGESFETMSLRIADKAGIDIFVIYRKEQKFEIISRHAPGYKPPNVDPATIRHCQEVTTKQSLKDTWIASLSLAMTKYKNEPFALALATDQNGNRVSILVDRHPTIGYTHETVESKEGKYSFIMQPLGRLLMIAAREGLALDPDYIYSSRTPTSRELVNFVAAGLNKIQIRDTKTARDEFGPLALNQLKENNIITVISNEQSEEKSHNVD